MLRRRVESRAAEKRKRNRALPTIPGHCSGFSHFGLQFPETLIIITISLQAVQNSVFQKRSLRVFDSQKEVQVYDVETNKHQLRHVLVSEENHTRQPRIKYFGGISELPGDMT